MLYALKNRWRDGTTHVAFDLVDFVARLAALVPPPSRAPPISPPTTDPETDGIEPGIDFDPDSE